VLGGQQEKALSTLWVYSVIWNRRQWSRSSKLGDERRYEMNETLYDHAGN